FDLTAGGNYTEHWVAWIDFNNDGVFDDNSEKVLTGVSGKETVTSDIIIPPGYEGQQLRLRIAMKYGSEASSACGALGDGEVEDYSVSVGGSSNSNTAPVANANGDYAAMENAAISFDSSGSDDLEGEIVSFLWDFDDGITSPIANPSHSYADAGSYVVTLTVTDIEGATHTDTADVTITVDSGSSNLPDACATQSPVSDVTLQDGVPVCLDGGTNWLYLAGADAHQSVAITTGHGTGNLDVFYKNGGWPSESDNDGQSTGTGNTECIYLTNATSYWSYFKITGNASGATIVVDFDTDGCR
ncbi:MAG: PKD domain-containing protein, partial [Algicola sp.]|nr:PKD domain-containing protein [Algicola sp.]